jgi:outer membrane lipoprotein SlyB
MLRAILVAALLALAGCQADESSLGGTVVRVVEAERAPDLTALEETARTYDSPLVPEVAWKLDVRLDDGSEVTVTTQGERRHEPGERVRLLVDRNGELLL